MKRRAAVALLACAVTIFAACAPQGRVEGPQATHQHAHAHGAAGVATFDVYAEGDTLHVLAGMGLKGDPALALWHRRSNDAGASWSAPVRVNRDEDGVVAPHPGEIADSGLGPNLIVAWTTPGAGFRGGPMAIARSSDGGATWTRSAGPALQGRSQSFMKILAEGNRYHMVWLEFHNGAQGLRYARSDDLGANWTASRSLATKTCECCWNSLLREPDGAIKVMYRGGAPRDMMLAGSSDGDWKALGPVGNFNWQVNACPHVGGALGSSEGGKFLHALAWTGRDGLLGLYHLSSIDHGATWLTPRRLGTQDALHADLAIGGDGTQTAVWDEQESKLATVVRAQSRDGGRTWSQPERVSVEGADASFPRAVATRSGVSVLWLENSGAGGSGSGPALKVNGKEVAFPERQHRH